MPQLRERERERETETETETHRDTETDRQTDRQRDGERDRQTDRDLASTVSQGSMATFYLRWAEVKNSSWIFLLKQIKPNNKIYLSLKSESEYTIKGN